MFDPAAEYFEKRPAPARQYPLIIIIFSEGACPNPRPFQKKSGSSSRGFQKMSGSRTEDSGKSVNQLLKISKNVRLGNR